MNIAKCFKSLIVLFAIVAGGVSFAQAQDVSKEMTSFLDILNGTEAMAEKAMRGYASEEVLENGMIPYGSSPKVTEVEGACYTVVLMDDGDENEYIFCWEDGKIIQFDWADMFEDDDE